MPLPLLRRPYSTTNSGVSSHWKDRNTHNSSPGLGRMISLQGLTTHAHLDKKTRLRWGMAADS